MLIQWVLVGSGVVVVVVVMVVVVMLVAVLGVVVAAAVGSCGTGPFAEVGAAVVNSFAHTSMGLVA